MLLSLLIEGIVKFASILFIIPDVIIGILTGGRNNHGGSGGSSGSCSGGGCGFSSGGGGGTR